MKYILMLPDWLYGKELLFKMALAYAIINAMHKANKRA